MEPLVGRAPEQAAVAEVIGSSGAVVVRGEPGVGKTALLEAALAGASGMAVLRATGVQGGAEVPYAGLAELLRPLAGCIEVEAPLRPRMQPDLTLQHPAEGIHSLDAGIGAWDVAVTARHGTDDGPQLRYGVVDLLLLVGLVLSTDRRGTLQPGYLQELAVSLWLMPMRLAISR